MHPKLLEFGNFFIPAYGVFVALGFLAGILVTQRLAKRRGLDPELLVSAALYTAIVGLAGAKLALILQDFRYYSQNPGELFSMNMLRSAGIFYGGVLAGLVFSCGICGRRPCLSRSPPIASRRDSPSAMRSAGSAASWAAAASANPARGPGP